MSTDNTHLTLGEAIDALAKCDPTAKVQFDFGYFTPAGISSYRGYYNQLAIEYAEPHYEDRPTVATVLTWLREADGKTFIGYKGGNYRMTQYTPLWAANHGEAPSVALANVLNLETYIVLETRYVP